MSVEQTTSTLVSLASQVCGVAVGPDCDLVAAGFDSITVIELANRATERFGVACTVDDVFDSPSLGELAMVLDQRIDAVERW